MKKHPVVYFSAIVTGLCLLVLAAVWLFPNSFNRWDADFSDHLFQTRYQLQGIQDTSVDIVHVDLNDETLNDPLFQSESRDFLAKVVQRLGEAGAKAIVFDIFFNGKSTQNALIDVSKQLSSVYYPIVLRLEDNAPNTLLSASQRLNPIKGLTQAAKGLGHISMQQDSDGTIRHYPLIVRHGEDIIPAMALRVMLDVFQVNANDMIIKPGQYVRLPQAHLADGRIADVDIPINSQGQLLINYAGPWFKVFPHYSLRKILFANANQLDELYEELDNTLVVISDTSTWAKDFGHVPLETIYPLSGVHSNVMNNLLTGQFARHTTLGENIALSLCLWLVLMIFANFQRISLFMLSMLGLLAGLYLGALWCFLQGSVVVAASPLFLATLAVFVVVQGVRFLSEQWQKKLLLQKFGGYFSTPLLKKIMHSPEQLDHVEKKPLAILFSDISGFTRWCNKHEPEMIREVLNQYFSAMVPIVFKYQGTIDKYMGDGLMVFFGDPENLENPSLNAVQAAIEMQQACQALRAQWETDETMNLHIRIGINFGDVVVGNMGSHQRMEYTVLGSHVNLGQRLESNAPLGGVLVSEAVYNAIKDTNIQTEAYGRIEAKGFNQPIPTYTILGVKPEDSACQVNSTAPSYQRRQRTRRKEKDHFLD